MTRAVQIAELGDQSVFTIDTSNNRVGIGSTLPTHKLDVNDGAISVGTGITMDSASGIITATKFVGPMEGTVTGNISGTSGGLSGTPDITVRNVTGVAATFTGIVTYEDVTNVDSVGIITARSGLQVTGGSVGIGSAIPAQALDILNANPAIRLTDTDPSGVFSQIDGAGGDLILAADGGAGSSNSFISLRVDGTDGNAEKLRIDSSGNITAVNTASGGQSVTLKIGASASSGANAGNIIINNGGTGDGALQFDYEGSAARAKIYVYRSTQDLIFDTAGSERLRIDSSGRLLINTTTSRIVEDSVGNGPQGKIQIEATNSDAIMSIISAGTVDANRCGTINLGRHRNGTVGGTPTVVQNGDALGSIAFSGGDGTDMRMRGATIIASVDGTPGSNDMPGRLEFSTRADGGGMSERLRITSRGGFQFSNGFMSETVKINTSARTGTQAVNLDDGMVHYFSTNSAGTWKPNFTMSAGDDINATIATGDVFSPTMIVAKGATSHYATTIQVDGSDVTPEFSGGAPSDGGGSGTFDVYNYTIIKTGNDTFKAFAAVSTYE